MFISVETNFSLWNLLVNFNRHLQKQNTASYNQLNYNENSIFFQKMLQQ